MSAMSVCHRPRSLAGVVLVAMISLLPTAVFAQASPFLVGANSMVANLQAWLAPLAVLLMIVLAFFALSNRMSWGWALSVMLGIVLGFGAPQIVGWIRGMAGV